LEKALEEDLGDSSLKLSLPKNLKGVLLQTTMRALKNYYTIS
jgi:hypothetical protein